MSHESVSCRLMSLVLFGLYQEPFSGVFFFWFLTPDVPLLYPRNSFLGISAGVSFLEHARRGSTAPGAKRQRDSSEGLNHPGVLIIEVCVPMIAQCSLCGRFFITLVLMPNDLPARTMIPMIGQAGYRGTTLNLLAGASLME